MNIKTLNKEHGFTIVEMVVVIVVIGILAAITMVAYNGVQNKARTATALTNAEEVRSKSELYAAGTGNGTFPTNGTTFEAIPATDGASLSPAVKTMLGTTVPSSTAPTALIYQQCTTSGARVGYWDSVVATPVYIYAGTATSSTTCSAAA